MSETLATVDKDVATYSLDDANEPRYVVSCIGRGVNVDL
jgi:hypothetical protein